ncbi:ribosomal protein L7/L12 [Streptomyces sp. NBC_00557]|uniref:ribosomal protein L7/L12 n=1 Tax=Streptomyces sp. NBC_00557 TaxID=2975776 RepID=UPI002E802B71|nr:ribosomal protein L7/L12 [Streptomyces sp. NBC_00557]
MTVMDVAFVCAEVPRDVVLVHPGGRPLDVVRVVRRLTGLSLWRSKALVDQAPVVILDRLPEEAAESAVAALREAGGQAELGQRTQPHLSGPAEGRHDQAARGVEPSRSTKPGT